MKKLGLKYLVPIILVIIVIWLLTGFYTLKTDGGERAVLTQFGRYVRTIEEAGLKWHIPAPIQNVEIVKCDVIRTLELGYRTQQVGNTVQNSTYASIPEESLMITGDENLVHTESVIQFKITNVKDYVFKVDMALETLKIAAESSVRRVVANHLLNDVLTDQKDVIQSEIREDLQKICDEYKLGIDITKVALQAVYAPPEVEDAFDDVIKAREDMNRFINEAQKQANEIVPAAEAKAQEIMNQANAYKEKRIAEAKGDVENFKQVYAKYILGPQVTRTRMYLETMQEILPKAKIYFMNDNGDTLRFLPIGNDNQKTTTEAAIGQ
ncbi:MAG: FtsH protease activity modulator HflK [Clostridia bacterium]|nr:FtsH protease activity modulator HflK [Clostridia bacterium]